MHFSISSLDSFSVNYSDLGYSLCPYRNIGNAILNQTGFAQSLSVGALRHYQRVRQTCILGVLKAPIFVAVRPTARGSMKRH